MKKYINGIDFIDKINQLQHRYESIQKTKNFLDDYRSEIRSVINEIESGQYFPLSDTIKEAEKSLLIDCYTIAEQMYKQTKYQILNFDNTEKTNYQKFLNNKLDPTKFSPNPRSEEISRFYKRYNSNKLFINKLNIYDDMIKNRHIYAHSGNYQFDISNLNNLINILLYLEFEYRMFHLQNEWVKFFKIINEINSSKSECEKLFKSKIPLLKNYYSKILAMRMFEKNIVIDNIDEALNCIYSKEPSYKSLEENIKNYKNKIIESFI